MDRSTTSPVLIPTRIDRYPTCQAQGIGVFANLLLHAQGSTESTLRVIFVGNRRTKEGEDAVTGGLDDVAFVAMHRLHHQVEGRVNNVASLFRIKVFHQGHRTFDIGKKGSDNLTLAINSPARLHCHLFSANALG